MLPYTECVNLDQFLFLILWFSRTVLYSKFGFPHVPHNGIRATPQLITKCSHLLSHLSQREEMGALLAFWVLL